MDAWLSSLLADLKRRRVTRVALGYAVAGTAVLEGAQTVVEALALPFSSWRPFALLVLAGFPLAVAGAWLLDRTPDGRIRVTPRATAGDLVHPPGGSWRSVGGWAVAGLLLAYTGWNGLGKEDVASRAVDMAVQIERAVEDGRWIEAYHLARALPPELADSTRERLLAAASVQDTLRTDPPGVTVSWRPFDDPEAPWEPLGTTPLVTRFPRDLIAVRLEREGHVPRIVASNQLFRTLIWKLQAADDPLPHGLFVPGARATLAMKDVSLSHVDPTPIGDFLMDRFEVTNRAYQAFVDADGYGRPELWTDPFVEDGRPLGWETAMPMLVDRTGRPGPGTWQFGHFPDGTADHPVTGVSWYEARAYARFVGRDLPTLFHWYHVAQPLAAAAIIPRSNYGHEGAAPVGAFAAVTPFGASDMAGNAREWVTNATGALRYTLGGGWDDAPYAFFLAQPQPPFDRSPTNGFRLITNLGSAEALERAGRAIEPLFRDFEAEPPAADEVFAVYRSMYAYDALPLNAVVEAVDTLPYGVRERITFDAGYGEERMVLYLFHPLQEAPSRQVVVYFPGSGALSRSSIDSEAGTADIPAFLVRSGRTVAFPVYKGTMEREDDFVYRIQDESNDYRDHVLQWRQDLGRSLDYLETRTDVDLERVGYFGFSWGGRMGAIMLATEPRLRVGVLYVAGLSPAPTQPVVDPFHFLPRVRQPVLMLSGQYDQVYPLDSAARPFFDLLGSPEKEHYVAEGGHYVPRDELIRESVAWFDRYLGPVR